MPSPRLAAVGAAAVATLTLAAPSASAAPAERHCVVDVVGQEADGRFVLSTPVCYRSFDQAQADAASGASAFAISSVLAVHYDGANFTGSSLTVNGTTCGGGYTNLVPDWRNRISSSLNGCSPTRFYDGLWLTGAAEWQYGSGNLGGMNNRADSVQYG